MTNATECDYLIVGGGVAGCVIARRLADRTSARIILLEAGRSDEGDPAATDLSRLDDLDDSYDWGFRASPFAGAPAELSYGRAKMLGGCANHNDCAFLIPPDSDFTSWVAHGAKGWGPRDVAPYFRRVEERVHVETEPPRSPMSEVFYAAGRELGLPDNAFRERIAAGVGWFPLNAKGALRQSTSICYLHPLASLPEQLEVWTHCFAERLIMENGRAVGATTTRGEIRARREVVLTAGAIQTPQLMMLSGLGPAAHLKSHGIPVVADLPGVGQHLLDHVAAPVVFDLTEPIPPWRLTPLEATMMIQIDADAPAPDVLFHLGLRVREKYPANPRFPATRYGVRASPNVARARSEGSITLASADPRSAPVIDLRYFSDPDGYDQRILLAAMRFARRLGETRALGSRLRAEVAPGPGVHTDDELMSYIRHVCETVYHASGTCVMGDPARPGTVVGCDLKVKGIAGLRVADASVFPTMVSVNICNTVMMIAEKAADLILADR